MCENKTIYDVSFCTDDLNLPLQKCEVSDKEYENVASNTISCDNKNVGWNIMKKIGYKGKGLKKK